MSDIRVLIFLVRCSKSLLLCEDIDTAKLLFKDMAECTQQLAPLITLAQSVAKDEVVMGRCRYRFDRTGLGTRRESAKPGM